MFRNLSLQARMLAAFIFMGLIVFSVALVGWGGNYRLSNRLNLITNNAMPSAIALWKINEGQTQVQSSERLLLNPRSSNERRILAKERISLAWKQINQGFSEYNNIGGNDAEETRLYNNFVEDWNQWKQIHEEFLQRNQEFESYGILQPWEAQVQLWETGQVNSPQMAKARAATEVLEQMNAQRSNRSIPAYQAAEASLDEVLKYNQNLASQVVSEAEQDVAQSRFWVVLGMILGPLTAIIFGFYFSNTIAKPLGAKIVGVVRVAEKISSGDLTTPVMVMETQDEIGRLTVAFAQMTQKLNSLIRQVQHSGIQITSSTTEIAASGKELEATVTEQVASTNQVVATAKEIAATSGELVKTMDQVGELAGQTAIAAGTGQQEITRMENTMRQLANATASISAKLGVISEKANNINSVVTTITKVADQTNLLSLNAAIEAEKAGEYGTGFAVVAREIRRLADQTAIATLDIESMVKDMQSAVSTGVMEMDKFTTEVSRGVEDVRTISGQIGKIIERVQSLTPRFDAVTKGMEDQSEGAQQISDAMVQLSEASRQTAQALRDTNRAIEQLNEAAQGLQREISFFKVQI
ncbi:HAMP domain-containing methyl-accepting chemotaxis protein [Laspinema olomoucense]|uniref:Methyl-accepting chemotaxis protein n=1 Tax=Laspinema olomoucense D3b TaxID=2953688 RepID=A0ABT2NFE1_9CYAN|nr:MULTISPECIES: methyl-accepting chemotaxis protein [unclassified Laspinema]MCT7973877.1 methyl-accepting chemotaxis protein [Laspinema sp. D3d]MCT7981428.1 methyl-accepting chemotaxis protein [Laspinema sp. D3b]MCT7996357.1 methyl-accepting chemotaxis protein [Laspinema sp. D3c]